MILIDYYLFCYSGFAQVQPFEQYENKLEVEKPIVKNSTAIFAIIISVYGK